MKWLKFEDMLPGKSSRKRPGNAMYFYALRICNRSERKLLQKENFFGEKTEDVDVENVVVKPMTEL